MHPAAPPGTHSQILAWADARAAQLKSTPYGRPAWFAIAADWQSQRHADLTAQGFYSVADVGEDSWTKVLLKHGGKAALIECNLPGGYTLRPLNGAGETDAYASLHRNVFSSPSMTAEWRARTLQQPDYRPDLDLVVVDPAGQLAAFCICWFTPHGIEGRPSGQIEPMGVREDMRGLGLGRALLSEGVRRLYESCAEHILVETDNYREAAVTLYSKGGFSVWQNIIVYRKDY